MLLSVPINGGHYAVDMLGGAAVAVGSICITRLIRAAYPADRAPGESHGDDFRPGSPDPGGAAAGPWLTGPNSPATVADQRI